MTCRRNYNLQKEICAIRNYLLKACEYKTHSAITIKTLPEKMPHHMNYNPISVSKRFALVILMLVILFQVLAATAAKSILPNSSPKSILKPLPAAQTDNPQSAPIPAVKLKALEVELTKGLRVRSKIKIRMSYKKAMRKTMELLEAYPRAPNRYLALAFQLKNQTRLLSLQKSEQLRTAILETCRKLLTAPNKYAKERFKADMLLLQHDLTVADATLVEWKKALIEIVARYHETSAEVSALIIASKIAMKLQLFDLKENLFNTMRERFPGNHDVIKWRWKHSGFSKVEVVFSGTFKRADGASLQFPNDRMGHLSIMVFWSNTTPGVELYLKQIQQLQVDHPGKFGIFSFNLDQLPDSGKEQLNKLKLDWTVMQLPGGKKHSAYRTYAQREPVAIFVNAYGRALLQKTAEQNEKFVLSNDRINAERYLTQLRSLFCGDFLVARNAKLAPSSQIKSALKNIQACFLQVPFRYRLSRKEALTNYAKADKLCATVIKKVPIAPDLWLVRNHRIIALLGMWNLACEPKYLKQAEEEAKAILTAKLPREAQVVARFCLAKIALRRGESSKSVLSAFIETTGGSQAPDSAIASASILAIDANARLQHELFRSKLLAIPEDGGPRLWSLTAFLRDRIHTYDLLRANFIWKNRARERSRVRGHVINHGGATTADRMPTITLNTLGGNTLKLPRNSESKLTVLLFIEPSSEPNAIFPLHDEGINKKKQHGQHNFLKYVCDLADKHVNKNLNTIMVFLSNDVDRIKAFIKTKGLTCQATMLSGGLTNPMVRQLGILSSDRASNVFLIRRDGTIAWQASGVPHYDCGEWTKMLGSKVQIEVCEVKHAYKALEKNNFKDAAHVFGGPYQPWSPDRYGWWSPRLHGQALANMGLKDWDAALKSIDIAIDVQKLKYYNERQNGRRGKNNSNWKKEADSVTIDKPNDIIKELWLTKAIILDKLAHKDEATILRLRCKEPTITLRRSGGIYDTFHAKLKNWRLTNIK